MGIALRARALAATLALALGIALFTPLGPAVAAADASHPQPTAAAAAAVGQPTDALARSSRGHHVTPPVRVRVGLDATHPARRHHPDAAEYPAAPAADIAPPVTEAVDSACARAPPTEELV